MSEFVDKYGRPFSSDQLNEKHDTYHRKLGINPEGELFRSIDFDDISDIVPDGVGIELEGRLSKPAKKVFEKLPTKIEGAGGFEPEIGRKQIEIVTRPATSLTEIRDFFAAFEGALPQNMTIHGEFDETEFNEDSFEALTEEQRGSRYWAVVEALKQEKRENWRGVFRMGRFCATHITLGVGGSVFSSELAFEVFQYLQEIGPLRQKLLSEIYEVSAPKRTLRSWLNRGNPFAMKERMPWVRILKSPDSLRERYHNIPQLIRYLEEEGRWEPYRELPKESKPGEINRAHEGTVWWGVRPKHVMKNGETVGLIEDRFAPALPPPAIIADIKAILYFIKKIKKGEKADLPRLNPVEWLNKI